MLDCLVNKLSGVKSNSLIQKASWVLFKQYEKVDFCYVQTFSLEKARPYTFDKCTTLNC